MFHGKKKGASIAAHTDDLPSAPAILAGQGDADGAGGADGAADVHVPVESGVNYSKEKSAEFNSKSREAASKWWSSDPLPNMIIIRMVMEPLRAL
eukprot:4527324-Pyramimonas_sp.AAC.1